MIPALLIEKKRDGHSLGEPETRDVIEGFTSGDIPDYQMAAVAMAIYFRGMSPRETLCLTRSMMAGLARSPADARGRLERALAEGWAAERFARMIEAQGGRLVMETLS